MYACLQTAAEVRPSRSKRPRPLPATSSVIDPLPGTVFAYGDSYIVRLYGFYESTGKAVFALLSADFEYECLLPTALSSRFLTSPPLPPHSELAAAVSQLLRHPPIFAYARAPRRAKHAVPHPRLSSSRIHPHFAQLCYVTGPLTSPLPPPRPFESIMLSPPGPSATSPQIALLRQWGVLSHPHRAVPSSYVIMSYADTLVRRYIVRHQPSSSIHNVILPPPVTATLIHGLSGQMVCLSASHSGRPIRLSDLTYLSIDAVAELFFIPSVHPVVTHLHTLSHHVAYSLICRGVSCLASSSLIRPLLTQPRIARRLRSGQSLRVVSVFSGTLNSSWSPSTCSACRSRSSRCLMSIQWRKPLSLSCILVLSFVQMHLRLYLPTLVAISLSEVRLFRLFGCLAVGGPRSLFPSRILYSFRDSCA